MAGTTTSRVHSGLTPAPSTIARARNAATIDRSPWARLTRRITPNMSDSPVANRAYSPPRSSPWTTTFTQVMRGARSRRR